MQTNREATHLWPGDSLIPTVEEQAQKLRRTVESVRRCYADTRRATARERNGGAAPPLRIKVVLNSDFFAFIERSRQCRSDRTTDYLEGIKVKEDPHLLPGCNTGHIDTRATKREYRSRPKRRRRQ